MTTEIVQNIWCNKDKDRWRIIKDIFVIRDEINNHLTLVIIVICPNGQITNKERKNKN